MESIEDHRDMEEEEEQPSTKRRRVESDRVAKLDARNCRIRIPASCGPGISQLTQELGLRSNGEAIQWLLERVRPELVRHQLFSSKKAQRPTFGSHSAPTPIAFAYPNGGINGKITALVPVENGKCSAATGDESENGFDSGPRPTVRATVVQASTVFFDTKATLDKAERLIAGAAACGSQLVVFPEAFIGGYPRLVNLRTEGRHLIEENEEFKKYHAAAIIVPGPEVDRMILIAGKYKVHIVMGVLEREGSALYSTLLFLGPKGQYLGKHRKFTPTASEHMICSRDKLTPPVYNTPIGNIGGLICWDNRLPLLRIDLYAKGVEIYCAPTADARDAWQASMTHIAIEGGCFVLSANQFFQRKDYPLAPESSMNGDSNRDLSPDSIVCSGGSVIISPSGAVLAGPNHEGETLISAELDLGEIARAKHDFNVVKHNMSHNSTMKGSPGSLEPLYS